MIERIVALAVLAASGMYLASALRMPLGTMARPGAGFYPVAVGAFACGVALVVVAIAFRRAAVGGGGMETTETTDDAGRRPVWLVAAAVAGFTLFMPWLGYPFTALLFVAVLLRHLGAGWRSALLTAVLGAEGSYYLFAILLGVALPRGFWVH